MSKTFADYLLKVEDLHVYLDLRISNPEEKRELREIIEEIFIHHLFDTILTHLPNNHHDEFFAYVKADLSNPDILKFLKEKIQADIEKEISVMAAELKQELLTIINKSVK